MTRNRSNPYEASRVTTSERENVVPASVDGYMIACVIVGGFGVLILALACGVIATNFAFHRSTDFLHLGMLISIGICWATSGIFYYRLDRRNAQACLAGGLLILAGTQILSLF